MRLKGYLRGLGAGIFISAVLMGIASSGKDTISDEEIKRRAAALGMVDEGSLLIQPKPEEAVKDLSDNDSGIDEPGNDPVSEADIKKENKDEVREETEAGNKTEVKEEDKTEVKEEDRTEVKEEDKTEDKGEDNAEVSVSSGKGDTDEDIRAKEDRAMGGQNENTVPAEPLKKDKDEISLKPAEGDIKSDDANKSGSFTLQIASGTTSYSVAKLLQKGGIITDADDFDSYLCDHHLDSRINHGVFKIPANAGYDEIAEIITGRKQ